MLQDKKAQLNLGVLVLIAVGIIVCLVFVQQIFNDQATLTNKNTRLNETLSIASARNISGTEDTINSSVILYVSDAPTGWKVTDCPLTSFSIVNQSGTTLGLATDYNVTLSTGAVVFYNTLNVNGTSNTTRVTYTYCMDGYNKDSGSRGVAGIIGLFAVLALAIWVIGYGAKEWLNN